MPSRRRYLAALGSASVATTGIAGCAALGSSDVTPPDAESPASRLDGYAVYVDGDVPSPPETADDLGSADAALVDAAVADVPRLAGAVRDGTPVAFAAVGSGRRGAVGALRELLAAVRGDYRYGFEALHGRPVTVTAVVPHGETLDTYSFVDEGGWGSPPLAGLGWALGGRLPECDVGAPEDLTDPWTHLGGAYVVGKLSSGERYASRIRAAATTQKGTTYLRVVNALTAAAGGYPVGRIRREIDLANDLEMNDSGPNSYTRNGGSLRNESDMITETGRITVEPASESARRQLTGCFAFEAEYPADATDLGYDFRSDWRWTDRGLLSDDHRYAGGDGRGTWWLEREP